MMIRLLVTAGLALTLLSTTEAVVVAQSCFSTTSTRDFVVTGAGCGCTCRAQYRSEGTCGGSPGSGCEVTRWEIAPTETTPGACTPEWIEWCHGNCVPPASACDWSGPAECGSCSPDETCDGVDNDGDGESDEGACDPDDTPCEDTRTDPVMVGTGIFASHPKVDVRFRGTGPQIEFVRRYTSADHWPAAYEGIEATRIGRGWFHTFDERLYAADARSLATPTTASVAFILRTATGRGRQFDCGDPVDPGFDFTCSPKDGGTEELRWDPVAEDWSLVDAGVVTKYWDDGRLLGKYDLHGNGWTVTYDSSTSSTIDYVEDSVGRRMTFGYDASMNPAPLHFLRVAGAMVSVFGHDILGFLTSARRDDWTSVTTSGDEFYEYESRPLGTGTAYLPHLIRIYGLEGDILNVEYVDDGFPGRGRVRRIQAGDGDFQFFYANEAGNTCADPANSTLVRDMTAAVPEETCHSYAGGDFSRLTSMSGSCPCGGTGALGWTTSTSHDSKVAYRQADDGSYSTYAYNANGLITAQCLGDDATPDPTTGEPYVTTDASTCPSTGIWRSYHYQDANSPRLTTQIRERSRIKPGAHARTDFAYNAQGDMTSRARTGYSLTLGGTIVSATQVDTWAYDATGRVTQHVAPAGQTTTLSYHTTAGPESGQVRYIHRHADGKVLTTEYVSYTDLGHSTEIIDPAGVTSIMTYNSHRVLASLTRAGRTDNFYRFETPEGRAEVTRIGNGPVRTQLFDVHGRLQEVRTYDANNWVNPPPDYLGPYEVIEYTYDTAGRRTSVKMRRVDAYGNPESPDFTVDATYTNAGLLETQQVGPRLPENYTYDPQGMGHLESVTRGDGDLETFTRDTFGRDEQFVRHFGGGATGSYASGYGNGAGTGVFDDRPTSVTDPNSGTRIYEYDDFGHLIHSSSPDFGEQRWRYSNGLLTETLHPTGKRSVFSHDTLGRVTFMDHDADNPSNVGQDYGYVWDNTATACGINGSTCAHRPGHLAQVLIEIAPGVFDTMEYDYNEAGAVTAERWPGGYETIYEYSAGTRDRLERLRFPNADSDMLRYEYDGSSAAEQDGHDTREVRAIIHEVYTPGSNWVDWATDIQRDSLGRLSEAQFADSSASTAAGVAAMYQTDGAPGWWIAARNDGGSTHYAVARLYGYAADGMTNQIASYSSGTDPSRALFYDGGNRLTCASRSAYDTSCPTGANLLESYQYDSAGNRIQLSDSTGTTSYSLNGNALSQAAGPSATRNYVFEFAAGGARLLDENPSNTQDRREYFHDGIGRVRAVEMGVPDGMGGWNDHFLTILYDHRSRPYVTADLNITTGVESREELYWDTSDRLINRVTTPDVSMASDRIVDVYAHIESIAVGSVRLDYTWSGPFERQFYDIRDPVGLPITRYEVVGGGVYSSHVWSAAWTPFGELESETGDTSMRPPWGFTGQLTLAGSESRELRLNQWRVYDPEVGQYVTAEPYALDGSDPAVHPYAYAADAPVDYVDPTGQAIETYEKCATRCERANQRLADLCQIQHPGSSSAARARRERCYRDANDDLATCMKDCSDRHRVPWTPFVVVPVPWLMWLGECLPRPLPSPVPSPVPVPVF